MQDAALVRWPTYWKMGCAVCLLFMMAAISANAQTFTSLFSFDGTDGDDPSALVQATDGSFYGTTDFRGANEGGTIFKLSPSGTLTVLYSFGANNPDGSGPSAGLVQAADGNFYGTTQVGGANGQGTVFNITPSGTLTTLYSFCSQSGCTDGGQPAVALIQATDGSFYGTTEFDGAKTCSGGCGTVFKITPSGALTTLHNFCSQGSFSCTDGAHPLGALVQATDGSFYGTTSSGGAHDWGTVFRITPSGTLTTVYSFCAQSGCTDGAVPVAGLVQASDGNFYGTTGSGGTNNPPYGGGTVFKITPGGTLTTLYSFCAQSGCTDGEGPVAGLVQATDGNFYGTTFVGGANGSCEGNNYNCGTLFKITPSGTLTTLYSFCSESGCTDGSLPKTALVQATNGNFYGTTEYGGSSFSSDGTVFTLSVGLRPFVETQPTSGKVGAPVKILGTNLTGSTRVMFNGTTATFTVISKSEITTTVPAGATTGKVDVTTPSGTLSSNVIFRVKP